MACFCLGNFNNSMRILVLSYTHTLSHLSRPLAVALELRRMGYDVVFAGDSPKISLAAQQGFNVVSCYEPDPEMLYGNIRSGKLRFVDETEIARMMSADIETIRTVNPDLVLSDGRFTAPISTQIARVRHAAIVNVSSTEYRALPYIPFFDTVPKWLVSRNSLIWEALGRINLYLEMKLFDSVMNVFSKLNKEYKLHKPVTATNCLAGKDITLLADVPEYFPTRNLPPNYHYIGPLTWKSAMPPPSWWPPTKKANRMVYITMGTTGVADFFSSLEPLLSSAPFTTVISTGGISVEIENVLGSIYCEAFLDGDLIMEQSDLVVCHGGNGTIYQALSHGKPIVGIPTIPDQSFNMRRVEALGVGKMISWKEFERTPDVVLEAVETIVSSLVVKENTRKFKELLSRYNAAKFAANIIHRELA